MLPLLFGNSVMRYASLSSRMTISCRIDRTFHREENGKRNNLRRRTSLSLQGADQHRIVAARIERFADLAPTARTAGRCTSASVVLEADDLVVVGHGWRLVVPCGPQPRRVDAVATDMRGQPVPRGSRRS
jgi:hypothetical protein